jgi:hypothetical protein
VTTEKLEQEVETLDKEAREALDKLADKREALQRVLAGLGRGGGGVAS